CLDCKIFMISKAKQWMEENDFDFIITGEVVGQRPMSQRKDLLPVVVRESGADDLLLRPLCAQNLTPTLPEREGWVDRDKLLGFSGRNRKPQMALAREFGFEDYASPAGGCCFLTDEHYSRKLVDLWQARNKKEYELDDIMLLKVGRHIRPEPHYKLIVSREDGENKFLNGYRKQFSTLEIKSHNGPLTLVDGELSDEDAKQAARIAARFSQGREAETVSVKFTRLNGEETLLDIVPMPASEIKKEWYV
ncbi:MAG: tRNA (5-methylaminomethyl-2-thiouridylate)-methyltransferase, partial [Gammaproteobacteria bacterium]|nr:tRNA (5-methylaminomethyl-2-thiouridylate)-methyltransferase [Gammaproteobacteria bacterium]